MENTTIIRIVAGLAFCTVFLVVGIFFLLTLSRALSRCSPQSRTMQPAMVWLLLIPFFNMIWCFLVVLAISRSLGNEFRLRNIPAPPEPAKSIGIAWSVCQAAVIVPIVGVLPAIASPVLWIIYWVKVAEFSRMLDDSLLPSFARGA